MKSLGPCFPFYVDDFIGGTMYMTPAEVGSYVLLLAEQWRNGFVHEQTALLLRVSRAKNRRQLAHVLDKFEVCEDGHLRNRKMEAIRSDRITYINEQSRKGKLSAANRGSTVVSPRLQPEGQPNVNLPSASSSASPKVEKKKKRVAIAPLWTCPESLNTDAFRIAFEKYLTHRKEKGSRTTALAILEQLSRLEIMGEQRAVAAIGYSIAQGWTGIFEEKNGGNGSSERKRDPTEGAR